MNATTTMPSFTQGVVQFSQTNLQCLISGNCTLTASVPESIGDNGATLVLLLSLLLVLVVGSIGILSRSMFRKKPVSEQSSANAMTASESSAETEKTPSKSSTFAVKVVKAKPPLPREERSSSKYDDVSALSGGDDVASTKLDLARVYVDMGQSREAQKLLNSVCNIGTAEQKKLAEALLARLKEHA